MHCLATPLPRRAWHCRCFPIIAFPMPNDALLRLSIALLSLLCISNSEHCHSTALPNYAYPWRFKHYFSKAFRCFAIAYPGDAIPLQTYLHYAVSTRVSAFPLLIKSVPQQNLAWLCHCVACPCLALANHVVSASFKDSSASQMHSFLVFGAWFDGFTLPPAGKYAAKSS